MAMVQLEDLYPTSGRYMVRVLDCPGEFGTVSPQGSSCEIRLEICYSNIRSDMSPGK